MQVIISHVNTDFDALASMIAAKKLYPDAQLVISDKHDIRVQRFLNIYRDTLDFVRDIDVDWDEVTEMILVDVASLSRLGKLPKDFDEEKRKFIVYDHHPKRETDVAYDEGIVEPVGAAVTLLLEEIKRQGLPISKFEASLFGLGIYTDTGNFTYKNTTSRDLQMAGYLIENGMSLEMVQRFSEETLKPEQQELLDQLLSETTIHEVDGLEIALSSWQLKKPQNGLATITTKLLKTKGTDAAITVVKMKNNVHVVGRANSDRITLLPILQKFGGGGHKHAGSATVKKGDLENVFNELTDYLNLMLKPAISAREIMTHPVKTLSPDTTIEEAGQLMYRYGHSGYPIVADGRLVGLITRRDLDKGNHHGLGHAPVKGYMTTNVITINPSTTAEQIQELVIEHNIGRLPVVEDGKMIGIVTRTNIIEMLHSDTFSDDAGEESDISAYHLQEMMETQLPEDVLSLLKKIGETASRMDIPIYLIGGIVRDILLDKPNDDIDIVVEGNGIHFAKSLQEEHGGEVIEHESFGTATWSHPSGLSIDLTSSRLEYYERPASLPDVETSTLEEDLQRRDFTINAMAIRLNEDTFGELIDPFGGREDIRERRIKVLHNISFIEDPTRIFRGVRFEGRFQFRMDEQTEKLALNSIEKVINLTATRIVEEMKRLFKEGSPSDVIRRLFELQFWQQFGIKDSTEGPAVMIAEKLRSIYRTQSEESQGYLAEDLDWFQYFLLPFYCNSSLYAAEKFALTKQEMKLLKEIEGLKQYGQWGEAEKIGDYHAFLKDVSAEAIFFILATETMENQPLVIDYVNRRYHLPKHLTGEDLMKLGLRPGPSFSEILLQAEIGQLNGEIMSKEQAQEWLTEHFLYDKQT
ncbi:CBS domain-containing protein [Sporosarcina sp. 179-K 3D1 HS]|uniref:CBS domain-containing protein n=1 Tax=Sporosarcina sp. 179-K 3D1 HS TaxID=3232169 RepID=UPI00399F7DF6